MPVASKKVGLGLGALALLAVGVGIVATRPSRPQDQSGSEVATTEDVERFRGTQPEREDVERAQERDPVPPVPSPRVPTPPNSDSSPTNRPRPSLFPASPPRVVLPCEPVFSPDGRYVACRQPPANRGEESGLYVFEARTGKQITHARSSNDVSVELFWPRPEQMVLAGVWGQTWKMKEGKVLADQLFGAPQQFDLPLEGSQELEKNVQAALLVTNVAPQYGLGARMISDRRDETVGSRFVEIFNLGTGKRQVLFQPEDYAPADVSPFLWSPQGPARLLVSEFASDFEVQASLWDAKAGRQLWKTSFSGFNVRLEWTPDGRYIVATRVTGSRGRDPFPQHVSLLIDARNGRTIRKFKVQNSLLGTAVSNKYLVTFGYEKKPGQNNYSQSWALTELQTGKRVLRCWTKDSPSRVEDLAISPDNRLIAGTSPRGFALWKVAALQQGDDKPQLLSGALALDG